MSDSTGTPPPSGEQPPQNPYGQQPSYPPPHQSPYGQPQYGQQDPYGQSPQYGQQPAYGGYGQPAAHPDRRPGTVMAAGVITLVFSGLTLVLFGLVALGLALVDEQTLRDQIENEGGVEGLPADFSDNWDTVATLMLVLSLVVIVWCIVAMVLAVFAMRRSNGARIGLVVSSALVAVLSLVLITSGLSAISLIAAVAVIVCLFAGGASAWYSGKPGGQAHHGMSPPVA